MRKFLSALLAVTATVCIILWLGCNEKTSGKTSGNVVKNGDDVVFTADGGFLKLTEKTSLKDYMDALSESGELVFDGEDGQYGFYIQSVFGKKAEGNAFWAVYTDLVKLDGDDAVYSNSEYGTFEYNGKTLNSASFGVSYLPCVEGYTYALVYSVY